MTKSEYSKKCISEALIRLLKTNSYSSLTIQQIVDEAQVSRMAYYRNFNSMDDILKYYLDSITDDYIARTQLRFINHDLTDYFRTLLRHLMDYREIGLLLVRAGLFDMLRMEFDRGFSIMNPEESKETRYQYYFNAGGMCNVYYHWLVNGCLESHEELTSIMVNALSYKR